MPRTLFDTSEQAGWLVIVGWEKFQHYRDRDPIWIKTYLDQLDRDEYLDLPLGTRGLLQDLRLLTARRRGRVRLDTAKLSRALGVRVTMQQLEALRDAGFLAFSASDPASKPLARAEARAHDRARGEGEGEKEKEQGEGRTSPHDQRAEEPPDFTNLDPALELEVTRLVSEVTKKDNGSETVLRSYAARLPLGAVVKVRESAAGKPAGYAVSALKDECRERGLL